MVNTDKDTVLNKIKQASEAYYNNQDLIMTDDEYDNLVSYAEKQGWLKSDDKVNDVDIKVKEEVYHAIPMLSLAKAKTEAELLSYFNRITRHTSRGFIVEPKLDGLALSIVYQDGDPIVCSTRGNGTWGEDVSYIINNEDLSIIGLNEIKDFNGELRGELICSKTDLERNNKNRGEDFSNERAAVSGILSKSKLGLGYSARLHFICYYIFDENGKQIYKDGINCILSKYIFKRNVSYGFNTLMNTVNEANNWRREIDFPTDGVVIKPVELIDLGTTAHHPIQYIAYKFPGEIKQSKVLGVDWGIGKTGRLTPVARIEPTEIDGVVIENVTMHNISWMKEKGVKIGSIVTITRANDVIPAIKDVIFNTEEQSEIEIPTTCPYCEGPVMPDGKFIKCINENCKGLSKKRLLVYTSKQNLDIEGLSEALINSLPNIEDIVDLLNIDYDTLKNIKYDGEISLGEIRAKQIYDNIQKAKTNTDAYRWLSILDIPNVGPQTSKMLLEEFGTIEEIINRDNLDRLSRVQGMGPVAVKSFLNHYTRINQLWSRLKDLGITPIYTNRDYKGTFCITGKVPQGFKNRNDYCKYLEMNGWKYIPSINKEVDYLITDDINSNSSKIKKAKNLGINIVTELPN